MSKSSQEGFLNPKQTVQLQSIVGEMVTHSNRIIELLNFFVSNGTTEEELAQMALNFRAMSNYYNQCHLDFHQLSAAFSNPGTLPEDLYKSWAQGKCTIEVQTVIEPPTQIEGKSHEHKQRKDQPK